MMIVHLMNNYEMAQFARAISESDYYPDVERSDFEGTLCFGMYDEDASLLAGTMVIMQGKHAYLDYLYVLPAYRNLGYGVKLLDVVRQSLVNQGVRYVYASINGANEVSGRLAARHRGQIGFPFMHVRIDLEENHG